MSGEDGSLRQALANEVKTKKNQRRGSLSKYPHLHHQFCCLFGIQLHTYIRCKIQSTTTITTMTEKGQDKLKFSVSDKTGQVIFLSHSITLTHLLRKPISVSKEYCQACLIGRIQTIFHITINTVPKNQRNSQQPTAFFLCCSYSREFQKGGQSGRTQVRCWEQMCSERKWSIKGRFSRR